MNGQELTQIIINVPEGYVITDDAPQIYEMGAAPVDGDALLSQPKGVVYERAPFRGVFYVLRRLDEWPNIPTGTMGVSEDKKLFNIWPWNYPTSHVLRDKGHVLRPWLIMACRHRCVELAKASEFPCERESWNLVWDQWTKFEKGENWR